MQEIDPGTSDLIELRERLSQGEVCAFVGAGMSVAAGLPDWYEIISELAAIINYQNLPSRRHANGDHLIDAAQAYVNQRGMFNLLAHLKVHLDTYDKQPSAAHRALARLPLSLVFTANCDDLLERAFRDIGKRVVPIVRDVHIPFMRSDANSVNVIKLYGDLNQPETIVLARRQHDIYVSERPKMIQLLQSELARRHTLYIGWDGSDPYYKAILNDSSARLEGMMRPGYAVMFDVTEPQQDELERRQIHMIRFPYGDRTSQLAQWLAELL
jgi:hypothetical protein